jgi:hypothetical protein
MFENTFIKTMRKHKGLKITVILVLENQKFSLSCALCNSTYTTKKISIIDGF